MTSALKNSMGMDIVRAAVLAGLRIEMEVEVGILAELGVLKIVQVAADNSWNWRCGA